MCGKTNPAEAEVCKHCEARLKPLIAGGTPPEQSGATDWINSLRQGGDTLEPVEEGDSFNTGDVSDWLTRLGQVEEIPEDPALSDPNQGSSIPDWLAAPSEQGDPNVPDWMEELGVKNQPAPQQAEPQDDVPDWLRRIKQRQAAEEATSQLSESQAEAQEAAPGGEEIPDWLNSIKGSEPQETPEETTAPSEGLPDWLSNLDSSRAPADTATSAELPDWLKQISSEPEEAQSPVIEQPDRQAAPTWLNQYAPEPSATPASESDESEWLTQFSQRAFGEPEEAGVLPQEEPAATPDWLNAVGLGSEQTVSEPETETTPADETGEASDWLSGLRLDSVLDTGSSSASGTPAFVMDEEAEQWFGADPDTLSSMPAEATPSEIEAAPDWLAQVSPAEASLGFEPRSAERDSTGEAELAPAELPTWLEAMRPVESAAPELFRDESDTHVENAGPLSGLRGALQAEPEIARIRKPPVYSNKLHITEGHQARIALLEELVTLEGKARPATPQSPIQPQTILRLVIAVILIAVTLWALLWTDTQQIPLPSAGMVAAEMHEVVAVRGLVESIPADGPVLLAFDYEPAVVGEMNTLAGVVVKHLQEKSAFLVSVSTIPMGAVMSEQVMLEIKAQTGVTYTNFTHLGYLPGGAGGLLAFAKTPRQVIPYASDSQFIPLELAQTNVDKGWSSAQLANVQNVADFALVVVMTDNANTARAWIEQVRPTLDSDTHLVMLVSAQAEPLVRPYYDKSAAMERQPIAGLLAGISGGAAYESLRGTSAATSLTAGKTGWKSWDALAFSTLAAAAIMMIGGAINLFLNLAERSKRQKTGT